MRVKWLIPEGYLGFHRLAIMGMTTSGMQPFQLDDSYVVCNGEIYGFEKWKEELKENMYLKVNQIVRFSYLCIRSTV